MTEPWLRRYLQVIASAALLAFGAAVMPQKWIVETAQWLGFEPFPDSPLTFYLARHLSLLYGFVGVALWWVVRDLERYRPLVLPIALSTIAMGVLQGVVDWQTGLPTWWTVGESLWVFAGGWILLFLERDGRHS